ncbi:cytochrome P450 302a1, mitochondrial-like [Argiope bruennichi]|uniref:cytochrome P450 302a1, mitochondrial-like n=1 Tax=Argiope bruennichi TaxID=94029 RepID=UPI00249404EA|nr:cytochrome P450 302a1, mitochondrial-like [Argiope bruennichi]XP_055935439.1 cytochrome P450 302a1, mitochondrial-like [Argiope bruennichi]
MAKAMSFFLKVVERFVNICRSFWSAIMIGTGGNEVQTDVVKSFEEMPGPKPLPFIGNLWRYFPVVGSYSFERLHRTYQKFYEEFGPIVREKVFGERTLVHVFHPDDMMRVYKADGHMPKRLSHRALEKYRRERPHLYSGPGLFPTNGEEWYNFRQLFQNLLMMNESVEACSNALEDITDEMVEKISVELDENREIDLTPLLFNWALECIGSITLNRRLGCLSTEGNKEAELLVKAANDTHTAIFLTEATPFSFSSYKKLEAAQNLFSEVVSKYLDEVIEDIEQGKNTDSLVAQMLKIEDASKKDVFTMILDMFMAGIDTTAFTLSFALYNLAKNKTVQQKLREEMIELLPTKNDRFTGAPLRKYKYLKYVVKETLRVNPVAIGTGRILQEDLVLGNYCVPAQTMVILQHQAASLQEQFFPNPLQFDPDRWRRHQVTNLVSCPFGYGHRMCVGMKFAYRELYLALSKMVRNFDISYHYEDIDSINRLINVPDKPLRLRLQQITE